MKTKVFKIIMMTLSVVLLMSLLGGCAKGCFGSCLNLDLPVYEDKEVGDFVVRFFEDEDKNYCEIKGTTEQGNAKRFLVIPEYIEGLRVESLGVYNGWAAGNNQIESPKIESDKIEKVYFESAIKFSEAAFHETANYTDCPNLKKVFYLNRQKEPYKMLKRGLVHIPRGLFEDENYYGRSHPSERKEVPANVSYCYNYDNAPNSGYYQLDDYDYGSKIEFIPKNPVYEGYVFSGWYKEPECINTWDFDTDTLPEEITENKEVYLNGVLTPSELPVYQETILYAKWFKQAI